MSPEDRFYYWLVTHINIKLILMIYDIKPMFDDLYDIKPILMICMILNLY